LPTSIQPFVIICLESALEAGELDTRLVQYYQLVIVQPHLNWCCHLLATSSCESLAVSLWLLLAVPCKCLLKIIFNTRISDSAKWNCLDFVYCK